jgi:polar amino acid transport system ATP-binding protein
MKLSLAGLCKSFGSHRVLNNIDLNIEGAHSLVFIGPSGGGKSTLLRILAGLEYPDSGDVILNDQHVQYREADLLQHRRSIGTVFQAFNLFPHLSALENVVLPLEKVHGHSPSAARDIAMDLFTRFHLQEHTHKRPAALSGGQRQRVAIVRATAIRPRLLLFDEPTSALDPEMTAEVLEMIEELRDEGRDLVLVTHEMGFARRAADQVALLAEGGIAEIGNPSDVFDHPSHELSQRFLSRILRY